MTSQLLKSKTIFLTIGVAGIVAAGSVMGATLKSEVDTIKAVKERETESLERRIQRLESSYEQLAGMKADIEAKIQQAKEKEAARR